jgi:predicted enzyme related to lactoylglutathione lyase
MPDDPLSVKFWEIGSPDPSRSKEFYGRVCGWQFEEPDELGYSPPSCGVDGIPGGIFDTLGGPPFGMICVKVPDLEFWIERAVEAGGTLTIPPTPVPDVDAKFAVVLDPDGNRLGFFWEPPAT